MSGTHCHRGRLAALSGIYAWLAQPAAAPALRAASFLEFVHITDTHVADFAGVRGNLRGARQRNQGSADALRRFFDVVGREHPPAFIVHTVMPSTRIALTRRAVGLFMGRFPCS